MSEMVHEDVIKAIDAVVKKFMELYRQGDAAEVAAMYSEDAVFMPPDVDFIHGRAGIQQFVENTQAMGFKGLVFERVEIKKYGDMVFELMRFTLLGPTDEVIGKGKGLYVWKNEQGEWKLHYDIFNLDLPAPK